LLTRQHHCFNVAIVVTVTAKKSKPKRPTQGQAAAALGVTREHLNRVLRGHRESRPLMRRYRELLKNGRDSGNGAFRKK
jgi:hypothetical protein